MNIHSKTLLNTVVLVWVSGAVMGPCVFGAVCEGGAGTSPEHPSGLRSSPWRGRAPLSGTHAAAGRCKHDGGFLGEL